MTEHIISSECLERIQAKCYEAGKAGSVCFTIRGADGGEIVRCKDCKHVNENGWRCECWSDSWEDACVSPDGFCAWAEKGK